MKRNLLAVGVSLVLTCILVLCTLAIAAAFFQHITAEVERMQIPPGHMPRGVNVQD